MYLSVTLGPGRRLEVTVSRSLPAWEVHAALSHQFVTSEHVLRDVTCKSLNTAPGTINGSDSDGDHVGYDSAKKVI